MHVIDGWSTKKGFDRTATPSSIAGLGEAVSTARLKGALANLEYNENKLRAMEAAQQTPERVLPENLGEAIQAMGQDPLISEVLGETYRKGYMKAKRKEWKDYLEQVSEWELNRYLYRV